LNLFTIRKFLIYLNRLGEVSVCILPYIVLTLTVVANKCIIRLSAKCDFGQL